MERLKALRKARSNRVGFIADMISLLLADKELYSDEVLFRDAVEEIYSTLRSEVTENGRKDLVEAYELAVLLKAVVSGRVKGTEELLVEIRKNLPG
ncbi:hypothetical protein [Thermococcus aciditolerans]|uniref:Uncharacterized protein n=1 Tax=Thermococcus aciditolerans TaxID=2598455 RepID=A0A5C0SMG2_9EURY|nr:hypothetical protein [Thermococcus aciditolerans]QEK15583.1 hypothetical protein FPV09_11405 [Thermococcus aciditolerans]